uniref:Uncharacterized protein n=1 Tax=Cacopsylla melanoneura TaxID=428564 RepID=A0A8D8VDG9_9HEMI
MVGKVMRRKVLMTSFMWEQHAWKYLKRYSLTVYLPRPQILTQLKPGGRLVFHKGNHYGHAQILTYIDRYPNGTYGEEVQDHEIEKPLEGLLDLKTQMDEFKLRLQGKYTKRYRIDDPREDFRHVVGDKRYGETINIYSISPYMPANYTGYTHEFFVNFDASEHRKQGFERSDMIV